MALRLQDLAGDFYLPGSKLITSSLSTPLGLNPARWLLVLGVIVGGPVFWRLGLSAASSIGYVHSISMPVLLLNFRDHAAWMQGALSVQFSVAGTQYLVEEVEYRPQGRVPSIDEMYELSAKMGGKR